jgi:hypothetical protein
MSVITGTVAPASMVPFIFWLVFVAGLVTGLIVNAGGVKLTVMLVVSKFVFPAHPWQLQLPC